MVTDELGHWRSGDKSWRISGSHFPFPLPFPPSLPHRAAWKTGGGRSQGRGDLLIRVTDELGTLAEWR